MTLMRHGDYIARVTYDEAIDGFFGEVINSADVITFYGRSVEETAPGDGDVDRSAPRGHLPIRGSGRQK